MTMTAGEYLASLRIESDVPIPRPVKPPRPPRTTYVTLLQQMKPGDSIFIAAADASRVISFYIAARRLGLKILTRREGDGRRLWLRPAGTVKLPGIVHKKHVWSATAREQYKAKVRAYWTEERREEHRAKMRAWWQKQTVDVSERMREIRTAYWASERGQKRRAEMRERMRAYWASAAGQQQRARMRAAWLKRAANDTETQRDAA